MNKSIDGFSKLNKQEKIDWVISNFVSKSGLTKADFEESIVSNSTIQNLIDGFSENTISNFILPFGLAPNFLIDGKMYCVPMVIEESSVVAAASSAAKYWSERGGFTTSILGTTKVGHIHFTWNGHPEKLKAILPRIKDVLLSSTVDLCVSMNNRGGGIVDIQLKDFTSQYPGYYQLFVQFDTKDSMGANFINSVLEKFSSELKQFFLNDTYFHEDERDIDIIMSILSNYTPDCVVRAEVSCPIEQLLPKNSSFKDAQKLAKKFALAVQTAHIDPFRATTHNKGIFNGIDAVVIATGNDFRAIEAGGHAFASRDGQYKSLSYCNVTNDTFSFYLEIPLALGTVGGLTSLHPLSKIALNILGNPSAQELMRIIASVGLAQNFAAIRSLVTTGIQKGHMKMHLMNIINHVGASQEVAAKTIEHFKDKAISYSEVRSYIENVAM